MLLIIELVLVLILAAGVGVFAWLNRINHVSLKETTVNEGVSGRSGYKTMVLYGVDSREGALTKDCHSDTIMIISINESTKDVKLVSVYRDTYLDNTNGEYRKATECYFFGGPERSVNMLNRNLDLDITDYIAVNFQAVVKVVDMLGGVDLEITDEEMELINGYCVENYQVTGAEYTPLTQSGYVHLTGTQALAYCRIRYTEGWDYKRTERQRTVLSLMYNKAKEQGTGSLISVANTMMPYISTSMSTTELIGYVSKLGGYYLADQTGFPFDKEARDVSGAGDCVVPVNLAGNVSQLYSFLYGDQNYTPSQAVQQISAQITSATGV